MRKIIKFVNLSHHKFIDEKRKINNNVMGHKPKLMQKKQGLFKSHIYFSILSLVILMGF